MCKLSSTGLEVEGVDYRESQGMCGGSHHTRGAHRRSRGNIRKDCEPGSPFPTGVHCCLGGVCAAACQGMAPLVLSKQLHSILTSFR